MSFLDIIMLLLVIVFFSCTRPLGDNEMIFGRDSTAALRGLSMFGIILVHINNRLEFGSPVLFQVGTLATGLFFFISGYGNMLSMNKNKVIELKWLAKKFLKIYIPFFVVYWFYYMSNMILYSTEVPTLEETIQDIFTISLPNEVSWFPKIIVLCFFFHWIVKKLIPNAKIQFCAISMMLCIYVVCMWKLQMQGYWYNSVLCYPFGILIALEKDTILKVINNKKKKYIFLICTVILLGMEFFGIKLVGSIQLLCALNFSIMCFAFTTLFKTKIKVLAWVGNNSFEFYLIHIACLQVFCNLISFNYYLYALCVILESFLLVFIYTYLKSAYKNVISRKNLCVF